MTARKYTLKINTTIEVTIDPAKITADFRSQFDKTIGYEACDPDDPIENVLQEHVEHLANMWARDQIKGEHSFVEGYGVLKDMGIKVEIGDNWDWVDPDILEVEDVDTPPSQATQGQVISIPAEAPELWITKSLDQMEKALKEAETKGYRQLGAITRVHSGYYECKVAKYTPVI